jgi:hypothetical protein
MRGKAKRLELLLADVFSSLQYIARQSEDTDGIGERNAITLKGKKQ